MLYAQVEIPSQGYELVGVNLVGGSSSRRLQLAASAGAIRKLARGFRLFGDGGLIASARGNAIYIRLPVEGPSLNSYGGYLKFKLTFGGSGRELRGPLLIIEV